MAGTYLHDLTSLTGAGTASGDGYLVHDVSDLAQGSGGTLKRQSPAELKVALNLAGTNSGDDAVNSSSATAAQGAKADTALQPAAIGSTVQAYDADLTTWAGVTPGTGVTTALGVAVGSAGAVVVNGGALGTPSSGTLTNCTFPTLNQNTTGTSAGLTGTPNISVGTVTSTSATATARFDASNAGAGGYLFRGAVNTAGTGSLASSDFHVYSDASYTQIGTERAKDFKVVVNSAVVSAFTSTGINSTNIGATTPGTGAFTTLSASGIITSTKTSGAMFSAESATTNYTYIDLLNTGGSLYLGINNISGSGLLAGAGNYASCLMTTTNTPLVIGINNAVVGTFSSTGLAVTGTLSSGKITSTAAGGTFASPNFLLNDNGGINPGSIIQNAGALYLGASTTATSYIAITSTGLAVTGLLDLSAATSGQIKFPATQNASSDANTLDDYDEYTAASAACTGAITTAAVWTLTKTGNVVTLMLPQVIGTAVGGTYFEFGVALPAKYRPASSMFLPAAGVTVNNTAILYSGLVGVLSTGGLRMYRDPSITDWGTAATTGTNACTVSWLV